MTVHVNEYNKKKEKKKKIQQRKKEETKRFTLHRIRMRV